MHRLIQANHTEIMATILSGVYLCLIASAGGEKSFSCIAGKFLLYRNHGGEILVVQLNALFLE
jgi:hypothetical protein